MSPARILKQLQSMHPGRYDLPTENQIQKVISKLTTDEKKMRKEAAHARMDSGTNGNERNANHGEGAVDVTNKERREVENLSEMQGKVDDGGNSAEQVSGTGLSPQSVLSTAITSVLETHDGTNTDVGVSINEMKEVDSGGSGRRMEVDSGTAVLVPVTVPRVQKKYVMPYAYAEVLNAIIMENPSIKPGTGTSDNDGASGLE